MPIITGNRPIFRIKFSDANIREVRKGNELEWGLYEIKYENDGPREDTGDNENITEYVWGYPDYKKEDFYLYIPDNIPGEDEDPNIYPASTMRAHSDGWYDNENCGGSSGNLNYIPAITRDFFMDLTLFCRWRQRQYRFSGTMTYDRYSWVEG